MELKISPQKKSQFFTNLFKLVLAILLAGPFAGAAHGSEFDDLKRSPPFSDPATRWPHPGLNSHRPATLDHMWHKAATL